MTSSTLITPTHGTSSSIAPTLGTPATSPVGSSLLSSTRSHSSSSPALSLSTPSSPGSPPVSKASSLLAASLKLEVCVDSIESCVAAEKGGASRIELCSGLVEGGLTPSYGLIGAALSAVSIPVHVLIRPRPGDFLYTDTDIDIMRADIMACKLSGASGVVFGCLHADGSIHKEHLRRLMDAATGMTVTFHRAIDLCPPETIEQQLDILIAAGVDRVLTAGLANSVEQGKDMIKRMWSHTAGRGLIIMAGGGITEQNLASLFETCPLVEVHASARSQHWGGMQYKKPDVYMGGEKKNHGLEVEYALKTTDSKKVEQMMKILGDVRTQRVQQQQQSHQQQQLQHQQQQQQPHPASPSKA